MSISTSVGTPTVHGGAPVDVSGLWVHNFPSSDLVSASAALFHGHRVEDRTLGVTLSGASTLGAAAAKSRELWPDRFAAARHQPDHELVEGPRWRVMVSPGVVAVRRQDPARAERAAERAVRAMMIRQDMPSSDVVESGGATVREWSRKSRSNMTRTLAELDWTPLFEDAAAVPAMVTLTYPGDWLTVAPNAAACRRHLDLLKKRFTRAWGRKLVGVWKREFQRRGAPHWHLLMVPPHGEVDGLGFSRWLSREWAAIVAHPDPEERRRHLLAGTGVDYAEGVKARDPRSIGVYFAKHGAFADKEYQNHAPQEWLDVEGGSVGRFWGVWGLQRATAGTLVHPEEARAAVRTMRRWSRANSYEARVPVWRYRSRVDVETGEVTARWRRSTKKARVYRVKGEAGFLVVKDGPAFASALARHLDGLYRPGSVVSRSGAGPVGFLP